MRCRVSRAKNIRSVSQQHSQIFCGNLDIDETSEDDEEVEQLIGITFLLEKSREVVDIEVEPFC